jgi:peptide chain release factor 1
MSADPLRPDLTGFRRRLAELEGLLADPATFADNRRAAALGAELRFTSKAVKADDVLAGLEKELADARTMGAESDPELRAMAAEEVARLAPAVETAREQLIRSIIPPDPDDSRNALVEIRAGTGGEEASLFAAELLRAYTRFAEKRGWKHELMSLSPSDLGGVRDAVLLVEGEGAMAHLRHEAGVHRVQRVPATEASGRVHTSAATVAVLPEAEEAEVVLKPEDLDMSVARASGAGGQHVNVTDSAVRITHLPTGVVTSCQNERSQHQNKDKAMQMLAARLLDLERQKRDAELAQIGGEKLIVDFGSQIRSYVLQPYQMVKDLRTEHEVGDVASVLDGDLDGFMESYLRWSRTNATR